LLVAACVADDDDAMIYGMMVELPRWELSAAAAARL
jgi:hypothetical protein